MESATFLVVFTGRTQVIGAKKALEKKLGISEGESNGELQGDLVGFDDV
jgi:hypothetical protein